MLNAMLSYPTETDTTSRHGSAEWHGDVERGSGTISVGEGVLADAYSFDSRFAGGPGTNPEQLLAAAFSGCFSMYLASVLSAAGHAPESVHTVAHIRLRHVEGQPTLTELCLETSGDVPGIDEHEFQAYAERAKAECPVSWALAGIPEVVLKATLAVAEQPATERAMSSDDERLAAAGSRRCWWPYQNTRPSVIGAETYRLALEM